MLNFGIISILTKKVKWPFLKQQDVQKTHCRSVYTCVLEDVRGSCHSTYTHHLVAIISLNGSLSGTEAICWCYSHCLSFCPDKTLLPRCVLKKHLDRSNSMLPGLLWRASPPRRLLRWRREIHGDGRQGKGWGEVSGAAVMMKRWAAVNRCHSHRRAATVAPTRTPTQGSGG